MALFFHGKEISLSDFQELESPDGDTKWEKGKGLKCKGEIS
jgi:hypothetical protein